MRISKPSDLVKELIQQHKVDLIKEAINYCLSLEIYSATDLHRSKEIVNYMHN